jgi:hypothetical protein
MNFLYSKYNVFIANFLDACNNSYRYLGQFLILVETFLTEILITFPSC